jgi:hypothetical protein
MRNLLSVLSVVSIFAMLFWSCKGQADGPYANYTQVSPKTVTGGDPVKINGGNLRFVTEIKFNGIAAQSFSLISDAQIIAYVSPNTPVTTTPYQGMITARDNGPATFDIGVTYYIPQQFQLSGTATYTPAGGLVQSMTDTGSVKIMQLNSVDTIKNSYLCCNAAGTKYMNPYADSANYVRLTGIQFDTRTGITQSTYLSFSLLKNSVVYAKLQDTNLIIPQQVPLLGSAVTIKGNGSLANNKLTLNYTSELNGNIKTSKLVSQ